MNDYALGDTIYLAFNTLDASIDVPTSLADSPTLEIYENNSILPIVEGALKLVLTQNLNSVNGLNLATITATTDNGFEAGKYYHMILKTGTVAGNSQAGKIVGRFSLGMVNAEVVDVFATDTHVEPAQGTPDATISLAAKINYLYKWARNKMTNDGITTKHYADNGTTVDQKRTTSESGGIVTKGEMVTGP